MRDGICQRERTSPRTAKKKPFLNPEMDAKRFDVCDQVLGCVLGCFPMRDGPATAALIEQNAVKPVRVEQASVRRRDAGAGATMQEQNRLSIRPPHLFEIDVVQATVQLAAAKGRLHRKQFLFLNESVGHVDILAQKPGA